MGGGDKNGWNVGQFGNAMNNSKYGGFASRGQQQQPQNMQGYGYNNPNTSPLF
jgi:hypothetical protein